MSVGRTFNLAEILIEKKKEKKRNGTFTENFCIAEKKIETKVCHMHKK